MFRITATVLRQDTAPKYLYLYWPGSTPWDIGTVSRHRRTVRHLQEIEQAVVDFLVQAAGQTPLLLITGRPLAASTRPRRPHRPGRPPTSRAAWPSHSAASPVQPSVTCGPARRHLYRPTAAPTLPSSLDDRRSEPPHRPGPLRPWRAQTRASRAHRRLDPPDARATASSRSASPARPRTSRSGAWGLEPRRDAVPLCPDARLMLG